MIGLEPGFIRVLANIAERKMNFLGDVVKAGSLRISVSGNAIGCTAASIFWCTDDVDFLEGFGFCMRMRFTILTGFKLWDFN